MNQEDEKFLESMKRAWEDLEQPHRHNYWNLLRIIYSLTKERDAMVKDLGRWEEGYCDDHGDDPPTETCPTCFSIRMEDERDAAQDALRKAREWAKKMFCGCQEESCGVEFEDAWKDKVLSHRPSPEKGKEG